MEDVDSGTAAPEANERLARLAARRRAAVAVHRQSSAGGGSSSDSEADARLPPHCGAALALRELLEERRGVFDGMQEPLSSLEQPPLEHSSTPGRTVRPASAAASRATTPIFRSLGGRPSSSISRGGTPAGASSRPAGGSLVAHQQGTPCSSGGVREEAARPGSQLGSVVLHDVDAEVRLAEVRPECATFVGLCCGLAHGCPPTTMEGAPSPPRLQVHRTELAAMLARQQAAAAERERQRLERQAQLQHARLEFATHHLAACASARGCVLWVLSGCCHTLWVQLWKCMPCCDQPPVAASRVAGRIARAWCRFLQSPGRQREVAAAVVIQATWRGWASRRRTAVLLQRHRQRQALLSELYAAVDSGERLLAQQAAAQLQALGAGQEADRLVAGLERRAAEAAQVLQEAAVQGGVEEYQAALAAAQQYTHLAAVAEEAAGVFVARVAAAEQAVELAVEGKCVGGGWRGMLHRLQVKGHATVTVTQGCIASDPGSLPILQAAP